MKEPVPFSCGHVSRKWLEFQLDTIDGYHADQMIESFKLAAQNYLVALREFQPDVQIRKTWYGRRYEHHCDFDVVREIRQNVIVGKLSNVVECSCQSAHDKAKYVEDTACLRFERLTGYCGCTWEQDTQIVCESETYRISQLRRALECTRKLRALVDVLDSDTILLTSEDAEQLRQSWPPEGIPSLKTMSTLDSVLLS